MVGKTLRQDGVGVALDAGNQLRFETDPTLPGEIDAVAGPSQQDLLPRRKPVSSSA